MTQYPNDESAAQFVLLRHEIDSSASGRSSHWDLMMQFEQRLETWAMDDNLLDINATTALRLDDHRLGYLDYEGPVSRDRGSVTRVDRGTLKWVSRESDLKTAELRGELIFGLLRLERMGYPATYDSTSDDRQQSGFDTEQESGTNEGWRITILRQT